MAMIGASVRLAMNIPLGMVMVILMEIWKDDAGL